MDREDQYDSETDQSDMEEEDRKESTRTNLGRIRLILQYVYDKPKLIRARDLQNEREMEHKKRELRAVNHQIDVMERPFGYFKNARGLQPRGYGWWEWFLYPKEWEHRAAGALYRRNKANRSCWWVVFVATTVVYFLLTMFCCFYASDFFNLSIVGALAYYYLCMVFPAAFLQRHMRLILYWGILCLFWDIAWLIIHFSAWRSGENMPEDFGREHTLRLTMIFLFLLRAVLKVSP